MLLQNCQQLCLPKNMWYTRQYPVEEGPYSWTLEYGQLNLRNEQDQVLYSYGQNVGQTNAPPASNWRLPTRNCALPRFTKRIGRKYGHQVPASCFNFYKPKYLRRKELDKLTYTFHFPFPRRL